MKPLSEMTEYELKTELAKIRLDADSTPVPVGERPSAAQLWHQLLSLPGLQRYEALERLQKLIEDGSRCFLMNHDIEIRALRAERDSLVRKYNELASLRAVPTGTLCGAPAVGGPCVLPAGHNMGQADVPSNHQAEPL